MTARSRRTSFVTLALTLVLGALLLLPSTGAGAATFNQGIDGTVTGPGSFGSYVEVNPLDPSTPMAGGNSGGSGGIFLPGICRAPCRYYFAGNDGSFSIPLAPGQYWVRFNGLDDAPVWWGGSLVRNGTQVTITADTWLHTDVVLKSGGTITGTVAQASTPSNLSTRVEAWVADPSFPEGYFVAGVEGLDQNHHYTVPNLPEGSYRIHVVDETNKLEGWWQGKSTIDAATTIAVTDAATVSGIDPALSPFATISGRVTNAATGQGVGSMYVNLRRELDQGHWVEGASSFWTQDDGTFTLAVPSGTYRIQFPGTDAIKPEYWSGASTVQDADDVVVAIGDHLTGMDVALQPKAMTNLSAPTISGTRRVDSTLTASVGSWYPVPTSYTYRWMRGSVLLSTATSYRLQPSDLGRVISLGVTAQRVGSETRTAWTETTPIVEGLFHLTTTAALRGTPEVGRYLRAVPPRTWPTAAVKYRWYRNGHLLYGRTASTFTMHSADRGHWILVRMTLTRPGYRTVIRGVQSSVVR